ncbi:MAG: hypothetical protein AAF581_15130 [Planctomycetota bacterium]
MLGSPASWTHHRITGRLRIAAVLIALACCLRPEAALATPGQLLLTGNFPGAAPQGITHDPTDNTFWVTSLIDSQIQHFAADLTLLGSIPSPFPLGDSTGIAYYSDCDTLLVVNGVSFQVVEIDKTGTPVSGGIDLFLPLQPVVNPVPTRFLRGMSYYSNGNASLGSFFVVETVGALIYEFDLNGVELRTFEHPDDPDGFPGSGAGVDAGGLELVLDSGGILTGFDLIGTNAGSPVIRRLDSSGAYTGLSIPLTAVGAGSGEIGGIARAPYVDPNGDPFDAIYGTTESNGSLFIVDGEPPPLADIIEIHCTSIGTTITLQWTTTQTYDTVLVERNGEALQILPGDATQTFDANLADGVYTYSVFALDGTLVTPRVECTGVIGAGQVQAARNLSTTVTPASSLYYDLTEDSAGNLWATGSTNIVHGFNKDLSHLGGFPLQFVTVADAPAGIAFRASTGSFLVANAADNTVHEVDFTGTSISTPITLQLPTFPGDEPEIAGMTFDPTGNAGLGSLWIVEMARSLIYEVALDGSVLHSFDHPEEAFEPTPDGAHFDNYAFGISGVPEVGAGHDQLDLPGGNVFEKFMKRTTRVASANGDPSGFVLPVADMGNYNTFRLFSQHNSSYLGNPVAFFIGIRFGQSYLFRVKRDLPPLLAPSFLRCRQTGLVDEVECTFLNHGPYDAIEVRRDGTLVATLPGTATSYIDTAPPAGLRSYSFIAQLAGQDAEPQVCSVRVGPGAVLKRTLSWPVISPYQMARNPLDGSFLITTNVPATVDSIYVFDSALDFVGTLPSTAVHPNQVAAIAVRPTGGSFEIYSILWEQQGQSTGPQQFFLTVQDATGATLQGPTLINIPGPPPATAITYPTGLTHDPVTDTLWFLERNTDTLLNIDIAGNVIQSAQHPAPPAQDFVFNLGLTLDASRNAFTATTSGFADLLVTKTVGFTLTGDLIGEEIPLDAAAINPLHGLARGDSRLWVSGSTGVVSQLLELKAADPVPALADLTCTETAPNQVLLSWAEPTPPPFVEIRRGGVTIATVPGGTLSFLDSGVGAGPRAYTVSALDGTQLSSPAACSLVVAGSATPFVRGDASGDNNIDIGDAVFILTFLFNNGTTPPCLDAADVGDDGSVNIGDAIYLLTFLFSSGPQPPLPYPAPGGDPTPDPLNC